MCFARAIQPPDAKAAEFRLALAALAKPISRAQFFAAADFGVVDALRSYST